MRVETDCLKALCNTHHELVKELHIQTLKKFEQGKWEGTKSKQNHIKSYSDTSKTNKNEENITR